MDGGTAHSIQITTDNAHQLQLAWSWGLGPGSQQTTPLVHDGVMYIANPGEIVQALDGVTGELLWEYRRDTPTSGNASGGSPAGGRHRNIAIYQDKIYLNSTDAHIVAIDARIGTEVWDTDVGGGARVSVFQRVDHRGRQGDFRPDRVRPVSG